MHVYVQEEEAQPLMQPSTGNLRSMAPALAQLFESRMKAGASKRATGRARQAEAAATAAAEPSQAEADDGMPVNADEAGPSQVSWVSIISVRHDALRLQLAFGCSPGVDAGKYWHLLAYEQMPSAMMSLKILELHWLRSCNRYWIMRVVEELLSASGKS